MEVGQDLLKFSLKDDYICGKHSRSMSRISGQLSGEGIHKSISCNRRIHNKTSL